MDLFYSDLCLLGGELARNLDTLVARGASRLEIMMDGGSWDDFEGNAGRLLDTLRAYPATYSLHTPCWDVNLASESHHIRRASLESALGSIAFAGQLGCRHLVIHPGYCQEPVFHRARARERAAQALETLCAAARQHHVRLAVENVGGRNCLYTQEEYLHLLDGFGPEAGYLLDVGHALLGGWDPAQVIREAGSRLYALHLHDNDGLSDSHLPMGDGVGDWGAILAETARLPAEVSGVVEYNYNIPLDRVFGAKAFIAQQLL